MRIEKHMRSLTLVAIALSFVSVALADDTKKAKEETSPPWSMADKYWGAAEMAKSRASVQTANGGQKNIMIMGERLEWQDTGGNGSSLWDVQGWYGGDVNKFWIKTEGEIEDEEDIEIQALYARAISSFWDIQVGLRYDLEPRGRTHAVLGVQGLAPYWFEIDAAAFVSTDGDVSASVEAEYELFLTQRLILQPRIEVALSAQDIPELGIGSGLVAIEPGVRLRYEIRREFAPYIGVEWKKEFGNTADFSRAAGDDPDNFVLVIGLRTWF